MSDPHEESNRPPADEGDSPTTDAPDAAEAQDDDTARPAIADDSQRPDESGTPTGDDLGAGGD